MYLIDSNNSRIDLIHVVFCWSLEEAVSNVLRSVKFIDEIRIKNHAGIWIRDIYLHRICVEVSSFI